MKNVRVIALYLPQYHRVPENDKWWGEGFTEWSNVKKAFSLFEGHLQPRVPYKENYYDLLNQSILPGQMKLAKSYGIDGFCFYHYWFSGKKLLERPLENLLKCDSIPLSFMMCWANEPWTRTWDGDAGAKQVLMPQDYGDKQDWKEHFLYLLPFFERQEYIKVDDRPVFVIYRAADISGIEEMLLYWNALAREYGFENGLFFINTHRLSVDREFPFFCDGIYDFEPFITELYAIKSKLGSFHRSIIHDQTDGEFFVYDYAKFCERMVQREVFKKSNRYLGFFTGWDNSPRVGYKVKRVFENNTPDIVEKYFRIQFRRSLEAENDFIFINAWNEWGEGAILEPDEEYGYGYLEAIRNGKCI